MERLGFLSKKLTSSPQQKEPVKVTITGGAGNIGYILAFMIGGGRLLGPDQPIDLTLLEIPPAEKALNGVLMELNDAAFPLLNSVSGTVDQNVGFRGCQIALLVGAKPRGKGMDRSDLLKANGAIFRDQARAIQDNAHPNVKIVVVGNPANTNAAILSEFAPKINPANVTSLTRLDLNRSLNQISSKLNVPVRDVRNVIIWGNHSNTQFPDHKNAEILQNGQTKFVNKLITDQDWIVKNFIPTVQQRGGAIIEARGQSSAASAASAVCDHIYSWVVGTRPGEIVSMGVMSDGSYGVPRGINFSFPVICKNGNWSIVQGLNISDNFSQERFKTTLDELISEKEIAMEHLRN